MKHPHFTDKEIEVQRGKEIKFVAEPRLEPLPP